MTEIRVCPVTLQQAKKFIEEHHRHRAPMVGWKFGIGLENDTGDLVGVITVGRPVARGIDDGRTAEVTRCCVLEGVKNGCSKLYAAAWRAARAMGYDRIVTYTLKSEGGTSLKASGWKTLYEVKGRSWNCPSRPRKDKYPLEDKVLWEMKQ